MSKEPSTCVRAITLTLCFIECLLFAGNLSSWSILVYVLKEDGIYTFLCEGTDNILNRTDTNASLGNVGEMLQQTTIGAYEESTFSDDYVSGVPNGTAGLQDFGNPFKNRVICPAQDRLLSTAFTVGIVVDGIMSIPLGWLQDKYGLRLTRSIASVLAVTSYLLLGAAGPGDLSWLILPGCICLALSCHILIMTNCHVCGLAGRHASKAVSLYNGGVNANFSFLLIKLGAEAGLSRLHGLAILTGLWSIVLVTTFFLLPAKHVINVYNLKKEQELDETDLNIHQKDKGDFDVHIQNAALKKSDSVVTGVSLRHITMSVVHKGDQMDTSILKEVQSMCLQNGLRESQKGQYALDAVRIPRSNGHTNLAYNPVDKTDSGNTEEEEDLTKNIPGYKYNDDPDMPPPAPSSQPPGLLRSSLLSPTYLLYLFWFSVLFLRISWFLNTYNTWLTLRVRGDIEKVSYYTNLFGYFKFGGILVAPLAGIYMDHRRRPVSAKQITGHMRRVMSAVPSLTITSLLSIILSVSVLLDYESAIYITLIAAEVFRAFLFATAVALLESVFSRLVYGKLFGVQYTVGAAVNFLMYPMTDWTESTVDGFTQANTLLLVVVGTTLVFPAYISITYFRLKCKRKPDTPCTSGQTRAGSTTQAAAQPPAQPPAQSPAQPSAQPPAQASTEPSAQPSAQPPAQPSAQPPAQPSAQPPAQASAEPSAQPPAQPPAEPSAQSSMQPSARSSVQPSTQPSAHNSAQSSAQSSAQPSAQPSTQPSAHNSA